MFQATDVSHGHGEISSGRGQRCGRTRRADVPRTRRADHPGIPRVDEAQCEAVIALADKLGLSRQQLLCELRLLEQAA